MPDRPPGTMSLLLILFGLWGGLPVAHAQAPLHLVNENTSVSEISFRFVDTKTFEESRLKEQLATPEPGFFTGLRNWFAFLPGLTQQPVLFDPVALQKDVVRLRQFYQQNGFPFPEIDYPATQLDTAANTIHPIFTIKEGPPLTIRERAFRNGVTEAPFGPSLAPDLRRAWTAFQQKAAVQPGERYTDFKQRTLESDVRTWLQNQGYAFAKVQSEAKIDTADTAVELALQIDPGPLAHVSDIQIEGNESVENAIIRRELPFAVGDRFSAAEVSDGQQQLFDLSLFRVVLADVPDQPRDSTVTVRYRVREAKLRAYSGRVGYGTQPGVSLEGSWRHRNFQGNARTLTINGIADTGYPENPPDFIPSFLSQSATQDPSRRFRASVTLRQPYLLVDRLSGSLEPFVQERINPTLGGAPDRFLDLSERQLGLNTKFTYRFLPLRTLSLEHSFARVTQFQTATEADTLAGDDLFDRSIFSLSGTFGAADDVVNPSEGVLFRPSLQVGGVLFRSGVNFVRLSGRLSGYQPVSDRVELAGQLSGGVLSPFGDSRANLTASAGQARRTQTFQDRFSDYLFYGGGNSDVRGWQSRLAGGKVLRRSEIARSGFVYRPIGGRLKLGVNLEARLPFPGLGSSWRTAVFLDGAYLTADPLTLVPAPNVSDTVPGPDGSALQSASTRVLVGTGAGLRYKTPFGFLRLDIALKLTPDALDLRRPGALGDAVEEGEDDPIAATPTRSIRRFRLHFGIGRSF